MSQKNRRRFAKDFKERAVALVENGSPVSEVARDFEVDSSLIYKWRREIQAPAEVKEQKEQDRELARLKKENERLKLDNAILKKPLYCSGATHASATGSSRGNPPEFRRIETPDPLGSQVATKQLLLRSPTIPNPNTRRRTRRVDRRDLS